MRRKLKTMARNWERRLQAAAIQDQRQTVCQAFDAATCRIQDAEAKRVRKGWRLVDHFRATWRNYHPAARRSELRSSR